MIRRIAAMMCTVALGLTATSSFSIAARTAPTPAAPVFSVTAKATKVGEGYVYSPGQHNIATDGGKTVYVASTRRELSGNYSICVTKSLDDGLTWGTSEVVASNPNIRYGANSIAVSNDPVFPGQKIVHTIWYEQGPYPVSGSIYYSYYSTNTPSWSAPVRINGSAFLGEFVYWEQALAVSSDGVAHIVFLGGTNRSTIYYTNALVHSDTVPFFPEAVVLTDASHNGDEPTIAVDSSNNVLVTLPFFNPDGSRGVKFTKRLAGSSQSAWSTPVTITTNTAGDSTSIAAFDANNLFIANGNTDGLFVYKSTNGGATWTKLRVTSTQRASRASIVINNKVTNLTVAAGTGAVIGDMSVYKSTDGGATWSAPATLISREDLSLGVDSLGKTLAVTWLDGSFYFTKEQ